jgi:hypothetical protein
MKSFYVIVALLIFSNEYSVASQRMPGCENIDAVSNAIKTHIWPSWDTMNRKKVKRVWPSSLADEENCETVGKNVKCKILSHKGRFTDWCECCDTFLFDVIRLEDGSYREQLRSITIFHTEATLEATIQAAQKLFSDIRASDGGADPQFTDWNLDSDNKVSTMIRWQTQLDEKNFIAKAIDLRIYQTGSGWTLYIILSRERVDLSKAATK